MRSQRPLLEQTPTYRRAACALAFVFVACGNEPDELYCDPSDCEHMDAEARDSSVALTPYAAALRVYDDDAACVACVERECEAPARACADEATCSDDVDCRVGCTGNPDCQHACADRHPFFDRPSHPLEDCVASRCIEECRVGIDYDCANTYHSPLPSVDTPIVLRLQLVTLSLLPLREAGLVARACAGPASECGDVLAEAASDSTGLIALELPLPTIVGGGVNPFAGYVEIADPADPPRVVPTLFAGFFPRLSNTNPWLVTLVSLEDAEARISRGEANPDRGTLVGTLWDCRSSERARGAGATIEIAPTDAAVEVLYDMSSARDETTLGGAFQILRLEPGKYSVTARHADQIVARGEVPVRAGAVTWSFWKPTER